MEKEHENKTANWKEYLKKWRKTPAGQLSYFESQERYYAKKVIEAKKMIELSKECGLNEKMV